MADGAVDGMDSAWLALVPRYDLGADMLAQDWSRVFATQTLDYPAYNTEVADWHSLQLSPVAGGDTDYGRPMEAQA